MAPKALDIHKNSLAIFSKKIKDRREEFNAKLSRSETISSADEHWLDNEGNTVEEQPKNNVFWVGHSAGNSPLTRPMT